MAINMEELAATAGEPLTRLAWCLVKRALEKGNGQKYILSRPDRVDHKIGAPGDRWKNRAWCDAS